MGLKACANCYMGQVPLAIQHLLFGIALLTVQVKALPLDIFKLVVLGAKHVDVSYDSRVPKVVEGIIYDKTRSATGVEDSMIGVLDTWAIEVGSRIGARVE